MIEVANFVTYVILAVVIIFIGAMLLTALTRIKPERGPRQSAYVPGYSVTATSCNRYYGAGYPLTLTYEAYLKAACLPKEYALGGYRDGDVRSDIEYADPRLN